MLATVAVLGFMVVLGSLNRWRHHGWHVQHGVHLVVYLSLLSGFVLRRRLSRRARAVLLILPLWLNGAANLVLQGLAGTGPLFLSSACALAVVLYGVRAALVALGMSTALFAVVGFATVFEFVPGLGSPEPRLRASAEWIAQGSAFVGLVAGSVLVLSVVHKTLFRTAEYLRERTQALECEILERRREEARRIALEEQLRQADKLQAIGQLAGGIAHDFNNQLAGIMGYAELLERERRDDPVVQSHAKAILAPARRAAELTQKLLLFARRGQYKKELVELHGLVHEVRSILERSIDKTITLELELGAPRSLVLGDPALLQSAVLNVVLNARDAMPLGGTLRIVTTVEEPWLVLRVVDSGAGMEPETLRHAFEPFFTTKAAGRGTGMGLPAVHGTMLRHGGSVEISSTVGEGTTVTLRFPIASGTEVPRVSEEPGRLAEGRGHILLVDDEPSVREATHRYLSLLGYRVTTCSDGQAAVDTFAAQPNAFELILLDMVLPSLSGAAVFRKIRGQCPNQRILLFSGCSPDAEARALLDEGALGFVQKPVRLADLSLEVGRALGQEPEAPRA